DLYVAVLHDTPLRPSLVCSRLPLLLCSLLSFFFFTDTATTEIYTLSLHDALPISGIFDRSQRLSGKAILCPPNLRGSACGTSPRSEEHTSELQSRFDLVCRLLLEKKKKKKYLITHPQYKLIHALMLKRSSLVYLHK